MVYYNTYLIYQMVCIWSPDGDAQENSSFELCLLEKVILMSRRGRLDNPNIPISVQTAQVYEKRGFDPRTLSPQSVFEAVMHARPGILRSTSIGERVLFQHRFLSDSRGDRTAMKISSNRLGAIRFEVKQWQLTETGQLLIDIITGDEESALRQKSLVKVGNALVEYISSQYDVQAVTEIAWRVQWNYPDRDLSAQ